MRSLHRNVPYLLAIVLWPFAGAKGQSPWPPSRFGDPSALLQAGASAKPKEGTDVVVLDEEDEYVFDASGTAVHTGFLVYKVLTQQGVSGWDSVEASWSPWHEEKPVLRARVITSDGAVHPLDPKTVSDAPSRDEDDNVYGDGRVVRAPLPAVAVGSIVEQE